MTRSKKKCAPDRTRHESHCGICGHARRQEIEEAFIAWTPQTRVARDFRCNRLSIWRHARAFGLVARRNANIRGALTSFVERGAHIRPTANAFVAACVALSKLDEKGRSVERFENITATGKLFEKMTREECQRYAETGQLPGWFLLEHPNGKEMT